ncbi:MAG: DUF898 family protein [Bradyrhizobium sp.]|uniref:DUF898 family protein n=1 Tax=Bradyrhizobium sp. TaxID=376 RepID=UPI003D0A16A5
MSQFAWTPIGEPPPVPIPPPLPAKLDFVGNRKGFFDMIGRGAGLELVTLGFYRFWLVTDIRRHLWSSTVVDGDAAEYTGRGRELLIGFLIALAILVPVYLGYFLISVEAEHLQALASIPLVAAFYVFGQFAIYRARRYRLTRTVWRGVRFWMDGSGWAYALRSSLWVLLAVVTLGLASPWRTAALERYKMQHSWYGDLQGDFVGSGWEFFKRIWWLWLVTPLALFVFPALPFLYAHYKTVEWKWWISGIRFGAVTVESKLPSDALQGLYWKTIGWYVLIGTAFAAVIGGATALVFKLGGVTSAAAGGNALAQNIPLLVVTVIGYMAMALAMGVVTRLYLTRDLWARVLATTVVTNIEAAAHVQARGDLATAVGEGIADGLDVAGF